MELLKPKLLSHKLLPYDEEDHKQHKIMNALLHYVFEKGEGEEVVGNVSCAEHESAVSAAFLSSCQGDFTIFHHLIAPIHFTDHTDRLCRIGFLHYLDNQKNIFVKCSGKNCIYKNN